ncbi:MAG TPA: MG2 domain-containing protein [Chthoniobacterales bacterium]|nr:MG2 domain-containing protein [Chthoniobacterales bacterium]
MYRLFALASFALVGIPFGLPPIAAETNEPAAQLLLPSPRLQPTSTFEVRFASEMVRPDQLGKPAADSPLVFEPTLQGQFVWLSTRSGSFAPSATLPLGVKLKISLRPGLQDASGNPPGAELNETAETPPMRLKGSSVIGSSDSDNATATPQCLLLFNTDVEARAAAKFIWWEGAGGKRVEANVEQADGVTDKTRRFYSYLSDDRSLATWSEVARGKGPPDEPESEDETTLAVSKKVEPRRNVLFVTAAKPLPPGEDWRLVLAESLPSAEWKIGMPARKEVKLGAVQPFVLESLDAETNRIAGRRLIFRFSKSLASKVTPETLTEWVAITPAVKNLRSEIEDRMVTVKGDFALDTAYQVEVKAGLAAREPFTFAQTVSRTLTFEKIAPRLYFEDFSTHQFAEGTRRFRLLSINVPRIRVTAHLFTGGRIPAAVSAYDHYQDRPEGAPFDETYSRVDVEKLGGKMIWERELSPGGGVDSHEILPLDWNEILGVQRTGAVLLTAESIEPVNAAGKRVGAQAFVQLTDLGAVWKRDSAGTFLHVFSLATGRNLPGVKLRLLDKSEKQLAQAVTDASGKGRLPKQEDEAEPRWVQAIHGDDLHLIAIFNGENDVPLYRLGLPEASLGGYDGEEQEPESEEVFLFSERGVYKPGDTLHLKGLARVPNDKGARVAAGKRLALTGTDARDREFFRKEITLSEFGSFTEDIPLPTGTVGKYRISAESLVEDETFSGKYAFQVQEYRPNAFEISVPPPAPAAGPAELEFPIQAKYFMGAPLSRAKVTWSLVARDQAFKPEGLEIYVFCDAIENYRLQNALDHTSQFNAQGTADLDPTGAAKVRTQFPLNPKAPQPRAAKLLCEITDLNQQTVSQSVEFVRQSSDYYFGLHRFDAVVREGEPLPIEVIGVQPDGKPLAGPAKATLRITRIEWQTNRLEGAGATAEFESKPVLQIQWEKEVNLLPGQGPDRKPIPVTPEPVVAGKPGEYLLTAIGRDAAGHEIRTSMSFEVAGPGSATWDYRNSYAIDVSSDKESYEPGQTATLLIKTPIAGEALVTVEHGQVVRSFVAQLTGNAPSIKVPIAEGDAPNVFVSVMVLRGAKESPRKIKAPEYRIGYCQLKVSRPREKLTVQVRMSAPAVKPGDKIAIDGTVRDFAGKPVADAEVTLYAVDEGVLSLTAYKTPDALTFFNQLRRLGVLTSITLPTMLREDSVESDFANKGYLIGDGKGGPAALPGLRTNFIACAYWNGSLRTNAAGQVRAEFAAPDSLTRYRVIAIATTKASQLGAGESAFEINKPMMLEPALPRFGNVGDKISLRAVVHNKTDLAGDAEIEMQLDATTRAGESKKRVAVAARGSVAVDFPIEFVSIGQAKWRWQVAFKASDGKTEFRDAVQSELKIGYPTALVREVTTKRIEQKEAEIARIADPQILEGSGEAKISLANTRTIELHEAMKQLLHYPYGCVEQTTSSLLPWLTVRDLRATFPELAKPDREVAKAVNHGIDLLLSMQTTGGGLSYWPNGKEPMLWGSAYGGLAFTLAGKAGFKVPEDDATRLFNYISAQLRGTAEDATGYGLSDRCLAVYSLAVAGKAEPAYHELLFKKRDKLSAEDRALVALAVLESRGPASMVDELLRTQIDEDKYVEQWFGSPTREYALNLFAWTRHQPRAPQVDELATELFTRRSNGHWGTTQGNAWAMLALSSYLRAVEKGDPNSRGEIRWKAAKQPFELTKASPLASAVFPIVPQTGSAAITVSKTGGQIFSEVTVEARPRLIEQPRQDRGYGIARKYARVEDSGRLTPATALKVGDRVLVTLDLEVRRRATYVVVEDPLPSVFEAINPEFKSQEVATGETIGSDWIGSHQELRQDRAVFFADLLHPGRYSLRYLARVVAAGDALAPSAKIQEMYHPERFGTTETQQMTASPLK